MQSPLLSTTTYAYDSQQVIYTFDKKGEHSLRHCHVQTHCLGKVGKTQVLKIDKLIKIVQRTKITRRATIAGQVFLRKLDHVTKT